MISPWIDNEDQNDITTIISDKSSLCDKWRVIRDGETWQTWRESTQRALREHSESVMKDCTGIPGTSVAPVMSECYSSDTALEPGWQGRHLIFAPDKTNFSLKIKKCEELAEGLRIFQKSTLWEIIFGNCWKLIILTLLLKLVWLCFRDSAVSVLMSALAWAV